MANAFNKMNLFEYKDVINEKVIIPKKIKDYYFNTKNIHEITEDTLIISMTSYPPRINIVDEALLSLLYQSANTNSYQCFLTLAKSEFSQGEKDLPQNLQTLIKNGWVKLLWHSNIYSHKKLMPVLQHYPNNDILIVDDDIKRPYNFISIFQEDHKKYPTDILCGVFLYFFGNHLIINKMRGYTSKAFGDFNPVPGMVFPSSRPANGLGGVLYPKHCFTDQRFFDESLFMKYSPTSDESWQYMFLIIENRTIRQVSKIIDYSNNLIEGSQNVALYKTNNSKYPLINEVLFKEFPEYKINLLKRQRKMIISVTSDKEGFINLYNTLTSILHNSMQPSKIILTIYTEDYPYLPKNILQLINNNKLELILSYNNIKQHLKYFEVMKKYRDYAIITINDNTLYSKDFIKSLFKSYLEYPNCIHASKVNPFLISDSPICSYEEDKELDKNSSIKPSSQFMAITDHGTLFPPDILTISDDNIEEIQKCIDDVDLYLKYLEVNKNVRTVFVPNLLCPKLNNSSLKEKEENQFINLPNNKSLKYINTLNKTKEINI